MSKTVYFIRTGKKRVYARLFKSEQDMVSFMNKASERGSTILMVSDNMR